MSNLTHLIFSGHRSYLQALVVGLTAPSLQHLYAELSGDSCSVFPIPHLCKLICDSECQFTAVRLILSPPTLKFHAGTVSRSIDESPFKIIILWQPVSLKQMGQELSGPLSTAEELIIALGERWFSEPDNSNLMGQWRGLFYHVPQVKMIQVPAKLALNVARSLQQDPAATDLLPALQRVEVLSEASPCRDISDAFGPLIEARQRAGCPIKLCYNASIQDRPE
ncbi:hypothetical protein EI94DRAFT_1797525 [Lactarius quietus]|nr:hypothetical protein EI94DRAFT_1797525 [Lactarius quietus]